MLPVEVALERSLATAPPPQAESVILADALGRVLMEDVAAQSALPPWDNSAMDGFAVRTQDTQSAGSGAADDCEAMPAADAEDPCLEVVSTIPAGAAPSRHLRAREAARIYTGAPLPAGADAVVMQEHTTHRGNTVQIHTAPRIGQNIRREGEDVAAGDTVLTSGTILSASRLGLAAAVGRETVMVSRQPTVGVIATGDELVRPPKPLSAGHIYSSNTTALMGLIREAGAIPVDCGIARDNLESTRAAFERASTCDLILSTGGVSVGDFDVVKDAMNEAGAEMAFWTVAMKPGKPLALGVIAGTPAFGLPGNPVSAQVGFLQFVRPWIRCALGDPRPFLPVVKARLTSAYKKKAGRAEFIRATLIHNEDGTLAAPLTRQGSGNQASMPDAHGLVMMPADASLLEAGEIVSVQLLTPGLPGQAEAAFPWQ